MESFPPALRRIFLGMIQYILKNNLKLNLAVFWWDSNSLKVIVFVEITTLGTNLKIKIVFFTVSFKFAGI